MEIEHVNDIAAEETVDDIADDTRIEKRLGNGEQETGNGEQATVTITLALADLTPILARDRLLEFWIKC